MTTKTATTEVVYNDLTPAKNEKGRVFADGQLSADDPRVQKMWYEAALEAADRGYCNQYDVISKKVGAPSRTELGVGTRMGRDAYYLPDTDMKGKRRKLQKIVFKGTFDLMGTPTEISWSPRLKTSGTREDINYVLEFTTGKQPHDVININLKKQMTKMIKKYVESQSATVDPVLS